jgi:hypothetical protein
LFWRTREDESCVHHTGVPGAAIVDIALDKVSAFLHKRAMDCVRMAIRTGLLK